MISLIVPLSLGSNLLEEVYAVSGAGDAYTPLNTFHDLYVKDGTAGSWLAGAVVEEDGGFSICGFCDHLNRCPDFLPKISFSEEEMPIEELAVGFWVHDHPILPVGVNVYCSVC